MNNDESPRRVAREDVVWGNIDLDSYEDVQLAAVERRRHAVRESFLPLEIIYDEEQEPTDNYQLAIRHILIAQACMCVLLASTQVLAPSFLAGSLGIAVLVSAILLAANPLDDTRIRMVWSAAFAFYLVACLVAMFRG